MSSGIYLEKKLTYKLSNLLNNYWYVKLSIAHLYNIFYIIKKVIKSHILKS